MQVQIGDIIEVLMSILFLLIKNHKFKMSVKLCGTLILDTTYTDISILHENIPQYWNT